MDDALGSAIELRWNRLGERSNLGDVHLDTNSCLHAGGSLKRGTANPLRTLPVIFFGGAGNLSAGRASRLLQTESRGVDPVVCFPNVTVSRGALLVGIRSVARA